MRGPRTNDLAVSRAVGANVAADYAQRIDDALDGGIQPGSEAP